MLQSAKVIASGIAVSANISGICDCFWSPKIYKYKLSFSSITRNCSLFSLMVYADTETSGGAPGSTPSFITVLFDFQEDLCFFLFGIVLFVLNIIMLSVTYVKPKRSNFTLKNFLLFIASAPIVLVLYCPGLLIILLDSLNAFSKITPTVTVYADNMGSDSEVKVKTSMVTTLEMAHLQKHTTKTFLESKMKTLDPSNVTLGAPNTVEEATLQLLLLRPEVLNTSDQLTDFNNGYLVPTLDKIVAFDNKLKLFSKYVDIYTNSYYNAEASNFGEFIAYQKKLYEITSYRQELLVKSEILKNISMDVVITSLTLERELYTLLLEVFLKDNLADATDITKYPTMKDFLKYRINFVEQQLKTVQTKTYESVDTKYFKNLLVAAEKKVGFDYLTAMQSFTELLKKQHQIIVKIESDWVSLQTLSQEMGKKVVNIKIMTHNCVSVGGRTNHPYATLADALCENHKKNTDYAVSIPIK